MRRSLFRSLTLAATLLLGGIGAEAQDLEWVRNFGNNSIQSWLLDVPDGSSDVYLAGGFQGPADFDPGLGTATLNSSGFHDAFVAKYNSSGQYLWARAIGGPGERELITDLETDTLGNVYIWGNFEGTADFDPGPGVVQMTAGPTGAAFLLKLDASGNFQWVRRFAGTGETLSFGMVRDNTGAIVLAGKFSGTADFNPGLGIHNLTATDYDLFLAKLNSSGNFLWAKKFDGAGNVFAPKVDVNGSNAIYYTGHFANSINVGGATLTGSGANNVFVAKYDSSGNRLWSNAIQGADGTAGGEVESLVVDGAGNAYRVGHFQGTISLGSQSVSSAGKRDIFLAKYNTLGVPQWIRRMGGTQDDFGYSVQWDGSGVYIGGTFDGAGDWDPGPGTHILFHSGQRDIYVGKYSTSGNLIWAHGLGGSASSSYEYMFDLTVDSSRKIYLNGEIGSSVDFDFGSGVSTVNNRRFFFAKYSQGVCVPPPPNLRVWYSLDDTTGSTVRDLMGQRNGVRVGPTNATGKVAGAFDFDGNDYVYATDHLALDFGTGDFTIDAWIKTTDSDATIVSKRQLIRGKYVGYLMMVYQGRLLLQMGDVNQGFLNHHSTSTPRLDDGEWHLVAVTVDRNSSTGGRMYVDGNLVHTFNPTSRSASISNSARLELGRTSGGGNYFDGAIDEVELFNRALSATEISDLWIADAFGKCKPGLPPAPLGVTLQCMGSGAGTVTSCQATAIGGSGGNSFSWSYFGDGTMVPSGSSADVFIDNCTGGLNSLSVTVTDSNGATASASETVMCFAGPG